MRVELVEEFLHSTTSAALFKYDKQGKAISGEYYLFNHKLRDKEEWQALVSYFQLGYFDNSIEEEDVKRYNDIISQMKEADKCGFIGYYYKGEIPDFTKMCYYSDLRRDIREEDYKQPNPVERIERNNPF